MAGRQVRRRNNRKLKEPRRSFVFKAEDTEKNEESQITGKRKIRRRYLILCEGETEAAYFEGLKFNPLLKDKFSAVEITIEAPSHEKNSKSAIKDNSLKGLVWTAMQMQKKASRRGNAYDQIWIVVDNDERNSYIITSATVKGCAPVLLQKQLTRLDAHMDDFFLCRSDYSLFLRDKVGIDSQEEIEKVLRLTDKNNTFDLYSSPSAEALFYKGETFSYVGSKKEPAREIDFDDTWKDWLQKAYSCRTFEHWLILHFELNYTPFVTSKGEEDGDQNSDSVLYIRNIVEGYGKGKRLPNQVKSTAYDILKPQPFNAKFETEAEAEQVLNRVYVAIVNAISLRKSKDSEALSRGLSYYEVDPYTNVDKLAASLLEIQLSVAQFGELFDFCGLQLVAFWDQNQLELKIKWIQKTGSWLINSSNIANYLVLVSQEDLYLERNVILSELVGTTQIVRSGEPASLIRVKFDLPLDPTNRMYIRLKVPHSDNKLYFRL